MHSEKDSGRAWMAIAATALLHVLFAVAATRIPPPPPRLPATELVDVELAPPPPPVEALPAEAAAAEEAAAAAVAAREAAATAAASAPADPAGEAVAIDAGVDARVDAAVDAPPDARPDARPDAGIDAGGIDAGPDDAMSVAVTDPDAGTDDAGTDGAWTVAGADLDAGVDDADGAVTVTLLDDAGGDGGAAAAMGDDAGVAAGTGVAAGVGSGAGAGATDEVAVDGAPTTAGTAANLLAYFPKGHVISALIRFDRLRGTEWLPQTERLLQPLPDYQVLFGSRDAKIGATLDTLVISTPRPRDATATTLVAHTALGRGALRSFLAASSPITWSAATGGMLGTRKNPSFPGDRRVILSPFRGWFVLAQPGDLAGLTTAGTGDLDTVEAKGKLPPWLAGIRKIEAESGGDARGPSLVVTVGLEAKRYDLSGGQDFGLGIAAITTPTRISLAMELVKQGWLVRGNLRFATAAAATEFVTAAQAIQERVANSTLHQRILGKAGVRVLANLSLSRSGPRVSYATSISIADARQLLALTAQQLDAAFAGAKAP